MRVVKNKILIFISFLDRKLALFVSKMVRRSSNSERVLLIPAASIDGGFGDDIMVKGFLSLCHYPVTICERKIEARSFWSQRIALDERYNGYFPCLKMLSLIMQHSELHVIGADILDGIYATNMFRFTV